MAMHTFSIRTPQRNALIDITPQVRQIVREAHLAAGLAVVFVPHTTAAVTINENADPDVQHDLLAKLAELIPQRQTYYQHGEGNSDSHLKTALTGNSAALIVADEELVLGTWQGVYFCEFDGPRTRQVIVQLLAG